MDVPSWAIASFGLKGLHLLAMDNVLETTMNDQET